MSQNLIFHWNFSEILTFYMIYFFQKFQEFYVLNIKNSNFKKLPILIIIFSIIDDLTLNSDKIKGF